MQLEPGQEVAFSTADPPAAGDAPPPLAGTGGGARAGRPGVPERRANRAAGGERGRIRRFAATVVAGGVLKSHQGVNVPDTALPIHAVTEKDLADLEFGLAQGVDWVAMSFVRRAEDLAPLRKRLAASGKNIGLMAKIEMREAVDHLEEIIEYADGVMVARGDLGIEIPLDQVPIMQKRIIALGNRAGRPVVTATQMLESMIANPRPTRAEVSDVANAVLDGTDAVMLSGETAAGKYPVEAVRVMDQVARQAEGGLRLPRLPGTRTRVPCETITDAIAEAAVALAEDLCARAIITPTSSGTTALMVARHRPEAPVVAIADGEETQRRLALVWGVYPLHAPRTQNTDDMVRTAVRTAREAGFVEDDDLVVVTAGMPSGIPGRTNLIKVEVVGGDGGVRDECTGTRETDAAKTSSQCLGVFDDRWADLVGRGIRLWGPLSQARRQLEVLARLHAEKAALESEHGRLEKYKRQLASDKGAEAVVRQEGYVKTGERRLVFVQGPSKTSKSSKDAK